MPAPSKKFYKPKNSAKGKQSYVRTTKGAYLCRRMKTLISFLIRFIPRKYLQRVSGVGLKILGLWYRGNAVTCPICQHHYRKFLPYGRLTPRENALCPNCLSLERHRLIWLYLEQRTDVLKTKKHVLHVAPEACFMPRLEAIHQEQYITADIESPLAKVKMDIHEIPFEPNTFDVILCNHVLEHVQDDKRAMREMYRVLKPGGFAILQVPFYAPLPEETFEDLTIENPRERERIFGQADHVRKFGKDYAQRIASAGFRVSEDAFIHSFDEAARKKYGLTPNEILYVAFK
jgi:SAM-dependent methyltransferase